MLFVLICTLLFTTWLSEGWLQQNTGYSFYQESCPPPSTYGVTTKIIYSLNLTGRKPELLSNSIGIVTCISEFISILSEPTNGEWQFYEWMNRECYKRPDKGPVAVIFMSNICTQAIRWKACFEPLSISFLFSNTVTVFAMASN